jgi:hypothetical protein
MTDIAVLPSQLPPGTSLDRHPTDTPDTDADAPVETAATEFPPGRPKGGREGPGEVPDFQQTIQQTEG